MHCRELHLIAEQYQLILESLDYTPPSSVEKMLYDFYTLSYAYTLQSDPTQTDMMGRQNASFISKSNIREDVSTAFEKLISKLKPHLLDSLFNSICSELKHFEPDGKPPRTFREFMKHVKKGVKAISSINGYQAPLSVTTKAGHDTIKSLGISYSDFVTAARDLFLADEDEGWWGESYETVDSDPGDWADDDDGGEYGGPAWAKICDGWLMLNEATTLSKIAIAIDHVYDLQHNGGNALDKNPAYQDENDYSYSLTKGWLGNALDLKAHGNIHHIAAKASSDARKITQAALKASNNTDKGRDITQLPVNPKMLEHMTAFMKVIKQLNRDAVIKFNVDPVPNLRSLINLEVDVGGSINGGRDVWYAQFIAPNPTRLKLNHEYNYSPATLSIHEPIMQHIIRGVRADIGGDQEYNDALRDPKLILTRIHQKTLGYKFYDGQDGQKLLPYSESIFNW